MQSIPYQVQLALAALVTGILIWLAWLWPTGVFYVLFGALILAIAAGVAWIFAPLVVYLRRNKPALLQADKVIELKRAEVQVAPHATSYSHSYHDAHQVQTPPAHQLALPEPDNSNIVLPLIPTFAQLLDSGSIGPNKPLILGYRADSGQAITGSWKDLYSCGIGAQQGAGKTWLMVFLLAQSAAAGGRLIVCDLHAGDDESLATRLCGLERSFMRDVADTPRAILSAFELANAKLEARKTNAARWPIILVCDEWTSLLRTPAGAQLEPLIQNIAEQGRKFNVNGILAAQAWTKDASGAVRNQLTAHYVMRQRPEEARYQLGVRAANLPDDIRSLPDATAYLLNVKGDLVKVVIPKMTTDDIARAAALIDRTASAVGVPFGLGPSGRVALTAEINGKSTGNQNPELVSTAPQSRKHANPDAERAAGLFVSGKDIPEIIRELRGEVKGRAYQTASAEIHALIREGMQG